MPGVPFINRFADCGCCPPSTTPPGFTETDVQLASDAERGTTAPSNVEQVLWQWSADFDVIDASLVTLVCRLTAQTKQTGAALGSYQVRVGGTDGAADGTVWATLGPPNRLAYPNTPDTVQGAAMARPVGPQLVKITAVDAQIGQDALMQAPQVVFA